MGFEPTVPLVREHTISSRAYSATLAPLLNNILNSNYSGESGIRTHDEIAPILVFETSALNRSAISPQGQGRSISAGHLPPIGSNHRTKSLHITFSIGHLFPNEGELYPLSLQPIRHPSREVLQNQPPPLQTWEHFPLK